MTDALVDLAEVRPVDKESVLARIMALATKPGASVEPGKRELDKALALHLRPG